MGGACGKAGYAERISGKRGGFRVVSCQIYVMQRKKLSEKVWQFGENAYLCTRKTEINAVVPK